MSNLPPLDRRDYLFATGHISALHFGQTDQDVRLVFLHANGFNAQTYRTILDPLPIHSVAVDLRGHGLTTLPNDALSLRDWYIFRDDVVAFIEAHIDGDFAIAGHSLGACVSILCAPALEGRLKAYVGFDPVTMPIWMHPLKYVPKWNEFLRNNLPIAKGAGRRRSEFESLDEAFSRYKGRGAFKCFPDEVLRDYLEGGLTHNCRDGVKLACDPKWEQAIYAAQGHNLFKAAHSLPKGNSRIIYGSKLAPHTPTARERMRWILGRKNVELHKELHHMFPLNNPEFATEALYKALSDARLTV